MNFFSIFSVFLSISNVNAFTAFTKPTTTFKFAGDTKPLGFFDPLQITKNSDDSTIKYLREAELQHSRISMVSAIIFPWSELTTHTPAVHFLSSKHLDTQFAWFFLFGLYELSRMNAGWQNPFNGGKPFSLSEEYEPGAVFITENSRFFNEEGCEERLNSELNNGRLAMLGVALTMAIELVQDKGVFL